ncbi:potassium channel family protein [Sphingomonas sp. SM33]|uniref:Potassium channel family protein n=1 Tax=Sphingomonas telluris TaxID=2907998 RepID=A0ABS9VNM9_9SPHN|nr:potassium channel family protein [Sphingomonas telluris]MCH8616588.1 potassium channel family protein [Sphingomonas telluris]
MNEAQGKRPSRVGNVWRAYGRNRYALLFYSLLMMLVLTPVAAALGHSQNIIRFLCGFALIAAVMPNQTKHNRYVLLAVMVLIVIVRFASERDDVPVSPGSMLGLYGTIGLVAAASALKAVVTARIATKEVVYAALSTYLLAGIFFGQLHLSVESYWPGSYSGPSAFTEVSALYFSFVTLATLGYGDFLPKSDLARGLTIFEVIGGQLYLAVMVARLIGLFPTIKDEL